MKIVRGQQCSEISLMRPDQPRDEEEDGAQRAGGWVVSSASVPLPQGRRAPSEIVTGQETVKATDQKDEPANVGGQRAEEIGKV